MGTSYLSLAMRGDVVVRAVKVAVVVGTVLGVINHGAAVLGGDMTAARWVMFGVTYLVPYSVSTYSSVGALRNLDVLCEEHEGMSELEAARAAAMAARGEDAV